MVFLLGWTEEGFGGDVNILEMEDKHVISTVLSVWSLDSKKFRRVLLS